MRLEHGRLGAASLVALAAVSLALFAYVVAAGRYVGYAPLAATTTVVFPLVLAGLLVGYVRRYREDPDADTLLTYAGAGSLLGGLDFLFIAYAVVTTQRSLGVVMAKRDVVLSELALGGVLFGLLVGHLYARTQVQRRREVDQYRAFVESASDVISVVEPDGTITYESPAVEDVLGYEPSALVGENGLDYIHPEDRDRVLEALAEAVRRPDERVRVEYRFRHADGEWRWLVSRSNNQLDDPAIEGIVVDSHDVTERKRRERELERTNDRLDEFASIVSHDLRNPLDVARGRIGLARRTWREGDEEDVAAQFDAAEEALDRMERLIGDLLTLAREGAEGLDTEPVELEEVVAPCADRVAREATTVRVDDAPTVRADPNQLEQLVENLLRNAVEHAGSEVTVTVSALPEDGFYVADDGPGIPEENRETVFDYGYSTADAGTGFGLAIVERAAEAHGWDLTCTDSESGGARFEFRNVDIV